MLGLFSPQLQPSPRKAAILPASQLHWFDLCYCVVFFSRTNSLAARPAERVCAMRRRRPVLRTLVLTMIVHQCTGARFVAPTCTLLGDLIPGGVCALPYTAWMKSTTGCPSRSCVAYTLNAAHFGHLLFITNLRFRVGPEICVHSGRVHGRIHSHPAVPPAGTGMCKMIEKSKILYFFPFL